MCQLSYHFECCSGSACFTCKIGEGLLQQCCLSNVALHAAVVVLVVVAFYFVLEACVTVAFCQCLTVALLFLVVVSLNAICYYCIFFTRITQ